MAEVNKLNEGEPMKPLPCHSVVDCEKVACADCAEIADACRHDLGLDND